MISRAVIVKDGKVLLIHRVKKGREYYVAPGGHIEANENAEETLLREIKEETSLDAEIDSKLWEFVDPFDNSNHHFFLVTSFKGEMELGGPEAERNCEKNSYTLEWHKFGELADLPILPEIFKEKLVQKYG